MSELAIAAELSSFDELSRILDDAPDETVELFFEFAEQYARAIDPAVRPYLAKLTAPRIVHRQVIDPYFRRVGAMLISIDEGDLEHLRQLMTLLDRAVGERVRSKRTLGVEVMASASSLDVSIFLDGGSEEMGQVSDALPTLELLRGARLVEAGQERYGGACFRWTHNRVDFLKEMLTLFALR